LLFFGAADLDPGIKGWQKTLKSRGFAGQFGHLLCRGQSGRSYGSQWQLALGTTKHGTSGMENVTHTFFFWEGVTARYKLV